MISLRFSSASFVKLGKPPLYSLKMNEAIRKFQQMALLVNQILL